MNTKIRMKITVSAMLAALTLVLVACNPRELPVIKQKVKEMDDFRTKETQKAVAEDPELRNLDSWCRQVPLPEGFQFVALQLSREPSLSYYYQSDRSFDDSEEDFRKYFVRNEWEEQSSNYNNRVIVFRKDSKLVTIQFGGIGAIANYSINCEDLKNANNAR